MIKMKNARVRASIKFIQCIRSLCARDSSPDIETKRNSMQFDITHSFWRNYSGVWSIELGSIMDIYTRAGAHRFDPFAIENLHSSV